MPLTYPGLPVAFKNPLQRLPCEALAYPPEGPQQVPVELAWDDYATKTVDIDMKANQPDPLSQICALAIDNFSCSVPAIFIFPDTGYRFVMPALAKFALIPVYSNGMRFVVSAAAAIAGDTTRFNVLNHPASPVYVP
jgi:hypothetical protein